MAKTLNLSTSPPITGYRIRLPADKASSEYHYDITTNASQAFKSHVLSQALTAKIMLQTTLRPSLLRYKKQPLTKS